MLFHSAKYLIMSNAVEVALLKANAVRYDDTGMMIANEQQTNIQMALRPISSSKIYTSGGFLEKGDMRGYTLEKVTKNDKIIANGLAYVVEEVTNFDSILNTKTNFYKCLLRRVSND